MSRAHPDRARDGRQPSCSVAQRIGAAGKGRARIIAGIALRRRPKLRQLSSCALRNAKLLGLWVPAPIPIWQLPWMERAYGGHASACNRRQ